MTTTIFITLAKRGARLSDEEEQRLDQLVSDGRRMLKELTVPAMAEFVGRLVTEYIAWAMLAGETNERVLWGDVMARAEGYATAMRAASAALHPQVLANPEKAEALVRSQREKMAKRGATPRAIEGRK